jgi:hypothetical protein
MTFESLRKYPLCESISYERVVAMDRPPLPATLAPFGWDTTPSSPSRYWPLTWALFAEMTKRLEVDGIVADPNDRCDPCVPHARAGTIWAPAVDLALDEPTDRTWFEAGQYVPGRSVRSIAEGRSPGRLLRGTLLRLEAVQPDRFLDGVGANFWSVPDASLDVGFIHSALEARWGGAARLADILIVPASHPFLGDDERADRLVRDLQEIARSFRIAAGLPANLRKSRRRG